MHTSQPTITDSASDVRPQLNDDERQLVSRIAEQSAKAPRPQQSFVSRLARTPLLLY